ncbi:MAG: DUF1294 domain-containing protein [Candidatus Peribacteria bacterium]|nr:DUF1294 domain-containing protein [Candidatus Peribacteria bacterium]
MDKWKSVLQKRRISEKNLLIFCVLGGWIGAILAMGVWRHKTIKTKFLIWFYLIVGLWIALGIGIYVLFGR